jgi:threonine dehydratase
VIAGVVDTPLLRYRGPLRGWDEIWLKDETRQITGAFKYRGASAAVAALPRGRTIVSATTGNHGLGLATAGARSGREVLLVIPAHVPQHKLGRLRALGATLEVIDGTYAEAEARARDRALGERATFVPSFDAVAVIEGHRTLFAEVDRGGARPDVAIVPVGGGGLIAAALAHWADGQALVEGVESEASPGMARSLQAGARIDVAGSGTFAEGLLVPRVGKLGFAACRRAGTRIHLVSDSTLRRAMRLLWQHHRIVAEGAGAAALAAALEAGRPGRCLCVVSGGNISREAHAAAIADVIAEQEVTL